MENTPNEQNINQQFNQQFNNNTGAGGPQLPNATASLVLGIVSTVFGLFWCYWIGSLIGVVCGIIAINMAKSGRKLSAENPGAYTVSSVNNNNAGRILGIIGLILGGLGFLFLLIGLIFWGAVLGSLGSHF